MDRINHVNIVTHPDAIDRFLREVLDIPVVWAVGEFEVMRAEASP